MRGFKNIREPFIALLMLLAVIFISAGNQSKLQPDEWLAPKESSKLVNPYSGNIDATAEGMKIFKRMCAICHGDGGRGDGAAGLALNPPPKDLTSQKVQSQADGELYWKITTGNPPMASYKTILTNEKRWKLVNYIRELGNPNNYE